MTDDSARIGDTVQAMAAASKRMGETSRGRSFVAGASNGESCKNTQFIKDVSVHTFPNENIQSLHTRLAARRLRRRAGPPSYFAFITITKGKSNSVQSRAITSLA